MRKKVQKWRYVATYETTDPKLAEVWEALATLPCTMPEGMTGRSTVETFEAYE